MSATQAGAMPASQAEAAVMLRQLRDETLWMALLGLYVIVLILFGLIGRLPVVLPALMLLVLLVVVQTVRKWSYVAGTWTLALGCVAVDLVVVALGGIYPAICLLALPAGLAALFIGVGGGAAIAATVSILLLLGPAPLIPAEPALRSVAIIGVWSTVGLIWLTSRPLVIALQWSWSSHERSSRLLEQARDSQMQLKQAVQDLAHANLQLTRLNRLAQGLRHAAEEARWAKEQFVANVSHELRTPLNMILGFSEMILEAPQTYGRRLPPALLADLALVLRNSQHLSSLIDDVLDLSQIEARRMALTRERACLHEIVEAAMASVRPLFDSKGLFLEKEVPEDLTAYCDRTRIREVVLNLLSNAGRFTDRGGVRIRAWPEGCNAVVSVTDTGPGIAPEDRDKLFRSFQQLDGSSRRRHGGSGLGLSISKSFVELHGGEMWLESEKGVGTTFLFRLPVDPPAPTDGAASRWVNPYLEYEERVPPRVAPAPVAPPRLVILEAGSSLQRLLKRYLDNVELVAVNGVDEAMRELARVPTQALVVNDRSVSETLERLSDSTSLPYGVPAILCSIPGAHEAAGSLGVADYLVKPVSRDTLRAVLARLELDGRTALVVDDEPEALRLFQRMLASLEPSYRVLRASDGEHALNILREQRPDVVLLDLVMPGMDGFRLLDAKNQDPALRDIPVVVTSAQDPAGHPIVSYALAATRGGGISVPQLLSCIGALSSILSPTGQSGDPALIRTPSDSPAC